MKAATVGQPYRFVVESERELPDDQQSKFLCGYLTPSELAFVEDSVYGGRETVHPGRKLLNALHVGLIGVDNMEGCKLVRDETLSRLPGGKFPWSDASLQAIPKAARDEVAYEIIQRSYLDEDARKNS